MFWSATILKECFLRSIVGFDVRVQPSTHQQDRSEIPYHGSWYDEAAIRLTVDPLIWPSLADSIPDADQNGFGLLDKLPIHPQSHVQKKGLILVAFDLPDDLARLLAPICGVHILPLESVVANKNFEFCGFDVVDIRTTSSAFYSFDWESSEIKETLNKLSLHLNSWGIIDDVFDAIKASKAFDKENPYHAPFAPCGIWINDLGKATKILTP